MIPPISNPYAPLVADIIEKTQESPTIFTLKTQFQQPDLAWSFAPGQFNMLYLYGVGEVPISIASDPAEYRFLSHTIRAVGRVTKAMQALTVGQTIGIRGPYGKGWPMTEAEGKDVVIITGGLGCAPVVSVINYIIARREKFRKLYILQGVKHSDDLIWRQQYTQWQQLPNTQVLLAADAVIKGWSWHTGYVTDLIHQLTLNSEQTIAMMCGPELMMHTAAQLLHQQGLREEAIYLSMERNMACGIGHCGHCQYGGLFICKDGPVLPYPAVKPLFSEAGF